MKNSVIAVASFGMNSDTVFAASLICRGIVCFSLLVLSIVDWRWYEIPPSCTAAVFVAGIGTIFLEPAGFAASLAGMFIISLPLYLLEVFSRGKAIGGGDVKLMAAAGLFLGWKKCLLAFLLACVSGSVIHAARMKWAGVGRELAFGPYLSLGIFISMWWGDALIGWYLAEAFR